MSTTSIDVYHAVIDARGLTKRFGDFVAVDDVDLTVERGEIFAFLGPNGAGKTTTINILTGAGRRTAGDVSVLGADPGADGRRWRSRVGVVPQGTADYADLRVREVIDHFAAFYPEPFGTDELLELIGLTAKSTAMASDLSGGQRRRLDVAVGLVGRPDLIFLDEPTTGLDPEARRETWQLIRLLHDEGRTTVLTTHYLDEVEALADRAGVIAGGRMLKVGTLQELSSAVGRRYRVRCGMPSASAVGEELALTVPDEEGFTMYTTDEPTRLLRVLMDQADQRGMTEIPQLRVSAPSFEETYLSLIGQARKDM